MLQNRNDQPFSIIYYNVWVVLLGCNFNCCFAGSHAVFSEISMAVTSLSLSSEIICIFLFFENSITKKLILNLFQIIEVCEDFSTIFSLTFLYDCVWSAVVNKIGNYTTCRKNWGCRFLRYKVQSAYKRKKWQIQLTSFIKTRGQEIVSSMNSFRFWVQI